MVHPTLKIVTNEGLRGYTDATINGGIRGTILAVGLSIPTHFILHKRSPVYRALPLPLKALVYVTIGVPCISICGEKAGEAFNRSQYTGVGQKELDYEEQREQDRWAKMTTWQKTGDWAARHKYGVVGAGWAASMALAFGIVARNPYQSTSQKIVQARMWAQGLTVALLLGSAALTGIDTSSSAPGEEPQDEGDHTWRRILEQDETLTDEERAKLHEKIGNLQKKAVQAPARA
ncbi:hypothetical protein IAT38_007546 [Cryptococcus sp. DSM 104549]